jgi:hypothetical protein
MSRKAWFMLSIWPVTWIVLPGASCFLRSVVTLSISEAMLPRSRPWVLA